MNLRSLSRTPEQRAAWREDARQPWLDEDALARLALAIGFERATEIHRGFTLAERVHRSAV